jgi:hypothetical protein
MTSLRVRVLKTYVSPAKVNNDRIGRDQSWINEMRCAKKGMCLLRLADGVSIHPNHDSLQDMPLSLAKLSEAQSSRT